jgi:outer membrane receptor protein involved in Fe transport
MKSIVFSTGLRYAALLLLVTDLSGGSPPALAQQQADTAATGTGPEVTVTVTARKREESLAEVPTSITAFTAETLKDYNVQSFADYASKTPDLSFTYGQGPTGWADARTIAIRGITGQNLFGTAGATGFYIDDTPVPGSVDPRVLDLASIEVLKGPQGTLFGESSLGGNVRLITRQPDLNNSGAGFSVDAGMTSGGGRRLRPHRRPRCQPWAASRPGASDAGGLPSHGAAGAHRPGVQQRELQAQLRDLLLRWPIAGVCHRARGEPVDEGDQ